MGFMTLEEMRAELSAQLSGRNPAQGRLTLWINFAMYDVAMRMKFEELRETLDLSLVADDSTIDIPTRFLGVKTIVLNGSKLQKLNRLPLDTTTSGQPRFWLRRGQTLYLAPAADQAYTGYLEYYRAPERLSADGDTSPLPDLFDSSILQLAEYYAFKALNEKEEAVLRLNVFQDYFEKQLREFNYQADTPRGGLQVAREWEDLELDLPPV